MRLVKSSALLTALYLAPPAFTALSVLLAGQAHAASYTLTDIAKGSTYSGCIASDVFALVAAAINDHGQVAGTLDLDGSPFAFLYSNGRLNCFTLTTVRDKGWAFAVNNKGWVTGQYSGPDYGYLYNGKTLVRISNYLYSTGFAINTKGTVVGIFYTTPMGPLHPYRYQNGKFSDLSSLGLATATGINDRGEIVGETTDGFGYIYSGITVNKFAKGAEPEAINIFGEVAGYFTAADKSTHTFIWDRTMHDLGPGEGYAINERGTVVGDISTSTSSKDAMVWDDRGAHDLNSLVPAGSPHLSEAVGINVRDQILANGCYSNGTCSAFILTPADAQVAER